MKGRDHLEDLGRRCEDNIRMYLRGGAVNWIHLAHDRVSGGLLLTRF